MKKILSSDPNRLDPLGDPSQLTPDTAKKLGKFMTTDQDPFADLFAVRASRKILEEKPAKQAREKTNHPPLA
jgi:hypothetical protein